MLNIPHAPSILLERKISDGVSGTAGSASGGNGGQVTARQESWATLEEQAGFRGWPGPSKIHCDARNRGFINVCRPCWQCYRPDGPEYRVVEETSLAPEGGISSLQTLRIDLFLNLTRFF